MSPDRFNGVRADRRKAMEERERLVARVQFHVEQFKPMVPSLSMLTKSINAEARRRVRLGK